MQEILQSYIPHAYGIVYPSGEPLFHLDMAGLDDPRAKQFGEKEFWNGSAVEEIRRSGFIDQLYKK